MIGLFHAGLVMIEIGPGSRAYQRLSLRIDFGPMQRMAGYNLYIGGQVFFKCSEFGGLAGGLTTDDGTDLGCFEPQVRNTCP